MLVSDALDATFSRDRLDTDYDARATVTVETFETIIEAYASRTREAKRACLFVEDHPLEPDTGLTLDVYGRTDTPRPAVLFTHGGYWRALSKDHSGFMAPMLAGHGIVTIAPDYRLAPDVRFGEIVADIRKTFAHVWHHAAELGIDRRRIVPVGSSAGGHLAASLLQPGWQAEYDLPPVPVHAAMPVSGLFDLAPIARCHPQQWLGLNDAEIEDFSPLRHLPSPGPRIVTALGEHEAPGFVRQSRAWHEAIVENGVHAEHIVIAGRNHFDVILDLCDTRSKLARALLDLVAGC